MKRRVGRVFLAGELSIVKSDEFLILWEGGITSTGKEFQSEMVFKGLERVMVKSTLAHKNKEQVYTVSSCEAFQTDFTLLL